MCSSVNLNSISIHLLLPGYAAIATSLPQGKSGVAHRSIDGDSTEGAGAGTIGEQYSTNTGSGGP